MPPKKNQLGRKTTKAVSKEKTREQETADDKNVRLQKAKKL